MCVLTDESKTISICNKKTTKQVDIKLVWNLSIIITLFFFLLSLRVIRWWWWIWRWWLQGRICNEYMNICFSKQRFSFFNGISCFRSQEHACQCKNILDTTFSANNIFSPLICEQSYSKYSVITLDKHTFIYHVFRLYLYEYLIQLYWIMIISNSIHP